MYEIHVSACDPAAAGWCQPYDCSSKMHVMALGSNELMHMCAAKSTACFLIDLQMQESQGAGHFRHVLVLPKRCCRRMLLLIKERREGPSLRPTCPLFDRQLRLNLWNIKAICRCDAILHADCASSTHLLLAVRLQGKCHADLRISWIFTRACS